MLIWLNENVQFESNYVQFLTACGHPLPLIAFGENQNITTTDPTDVSVFPFLFPYLPLLKTPFLDTFEPKHLSSSIYILLTFNYLNKQYNRIHLFLNHLQNSLKTQIFRHFIHFLCPMYQIAAVCAYQKDKVTYNKYVYNKLS